MKGRDPLWQTAWFFILPVKNTTWYPTRATVAHCGGSPSFASTRALALATVTLADDYIKAKSAAEAAEAKCRALEAELAALRDRQAQNNGKHPNHNRK